MTQRIFDATNEKDVKELFDLLPEYVIKISVDKHGDVYFHNKEHAFHSNLLKINWHDLTEIKRPVDYSQYIGKIGWFWDYGEEKKAGILESIRESGLFVSDYRDSWENFRPLTLEEIKEKGLV